MRTIIFILLSVIFAGCAPKIVLNPPADHIYFIPEGAQIQTVNKGTILTDKPFLLISEQYFEELWQALKESKQ